MIKTARISSKGQITLPLEIRTRLGVGEGDRVEFHVEKGVTTLHPAAAEENPLERFIGIAPAFKSAAEINAWIREMRDGDDER